MVKCIQKVILGKYTQNAYIRENNIKCIIYSYNVRKGACKNIHMRHIAYKMDAFGEMHIK